MSDSGRLSIGNTALNKQQNIKVQYIFKNKNDTIVKICLSRIE